ncbi:beta-N-acetylhexosaminidase [Arthrobacter sp. 35W]|uniref:beta-N-acetylhexosaminidase n=1 Tax=Arthrobacter sp. 35W TaxID=1132441 RepID=UPI00041EEA87|nr:glycoside hydrolase family 20 protein [Arthrobacter sp. 35W]
MPNRVTSPPVVPSLQHWSGSPRRLDASGPLAIDGDGVLAPLAAQLGAELLELRGGSRHGAAPEATVRLVLDAGFAGDGDVVVPATALDEAYLLTVGDEVVITARTARGVFYGTRTLLQLLSGSAELNHGTAVDWPNYPVRGFMLDVGRRYAAPGFIRDCIRFLGWYKMNTFIIHLNDNEIAKDTKRSWAEAQQAFRLASDNPAFAGLAAEDGVYTRADWDSFEDLAARHGMTLVPEIDAPAHSRSFIRWRPELGLKGGDSDMLDLSKPESTELMKSIFTEFVPWFRGPEVHFGADEYTKEHEGAYRGYFNTIAAHLRSLGKAPMAWGSLTHMNDGAGLDPAENPAADDGTPAGYDRDVVVCSWNNGWYGPNEAINDGYTIINTNDDLLYLVPLADYYHGEHLDGEALFAGWEPHIFADGQSVEPGHPQLRGAASALWNDLVLADYDERLMYRMLEPTLGLLAQKMWSGAPDGVDYSGFMERTEAVGHWAGAEFLGTAHRNTRDPLASS